MDWWWKLFQGNSDIIIDSCTYIYIYIQVSVRDITLECLQITPTKFRGSTFPGNMHKYITICSCAYYQETLISWILWELCPFELNNFRNILLKQLVSTTPVRLLNRISWNLVGSKDTICSCAYYQEMLIPEILWELFANTLV
jgi:hypothetical protein